MTTQFPVHSLESAPTKSKPLLASLAETFGFLPNIAGAMAESPVLLSAFVPLFTTVHAGTFDESEIQTVLLTNAITNKSEWPAALHTLLALKAGVAAADVEAMRRGEPLSDCKLAALSTLAKSLIEARGRVAAEVVDAFIEVGYRRDQALELLAISAASTMTNFVSGLANQPLDAPIQAHAWSAPR